MSTFIELKNSSSAYGAFQDTTTQSASAINTPTLIQCNTTDISNGVTVVANTKFTVNSAGVYNCQFSAQVDRVAGAGVELINFWNRVNGLDVPGTTGIITMAGNANASASIVSWNIILHLNAGDYIQYLWSTPDLNIQLVDFPAQVAIPCPASPSMIVTLQKID